MEIASRRREQEVWQACDDLWAQNGNLSALTGESIRSQLVNLGKSRGSPNEIYRYRKSWAQSRGIEGQARSEELSDPISRAVRMVHDQLKTESDTKITEIKEEFQQALQEKDRIIERLNENNKQLVHEYGLLQTRLNEEKRLLSDLEKQVLAEREVRSALEHELSLVKRSFSEAKEANSLLLAELKHAHESELTRNHDSFLAREKTLKEDLEKSLNTQKEQGFMFSEQLTNERMERYNIQAALTNAQENIKHLDMKLADLNARLLSEKERASKTMAEAQRLSKERDLLEASLSHEQSVARNALLKLKNIERELLKKNILIARFRAVRALGAD